MVEHSPPLSKPNRAIVASRCSLTPGVIACAFLVSTVALAQVPPPPEPPAQGPSKDQTEAKKKADKTPSDHPDGQIVQEPPADQPTLDEQVEEWTETCRPYVVSELRFLWAACARTHEDGDRNDLSAAQRERIIRDVGLLLKQTATAIAAVERQKTQEGQDAKPPILREFKRLQDGMKTIAKAQLFPELWDRYQVEAKKRSASRKRVAIGIVVAKLDRALILSAEQHTQVFTSLSSHWTDDWWGSLYVFPNERKDFSVIPDQIILPFLSSSQKEVWQTLKNPPPSVGCGGGSGSNDEAFDDAFASIVSQGTDDDPELEKIVPRKGEARP